MIKKGDTVYVRTGSDKGKTGRVLHVNVKKKVALVEGINMHKKHQRPTNNNPKGGILTVEQPIHLSNIALFVHSDGGPTPTRMKKKVISDGDKKRRVRISMLTGEEI